MRRSVTSDLCDSIAGDLAAGADPAAVAAKYGVTVFVVESILRNHPAPTSPPPADPPHVVAREDFGLEPEDLARIRRLAEAGHGPRKLADEVRLGRDLVVRIRRRQQLLHRLAAGQSMPEAAAAMGLSQTAAKRLANLEPRFGFQWQLREDERHVIAPTRCPRCGASLRVLPCRLCRIRDLLAAGERVWLD